MQTYRNTSLGVKISWASAKRFAVASFRNSYAQFFKPVWCSNFSKLSDNLVNIRCSSTSHCLKQFWESVLFSCFFSARVVLAVDLTLWLICRKCSKKWILLFMKRKSISDRQSLESISDKRLRIEVQPARTNGVERIKRFVNVHLHWIVSNLQRISKISTLPPLEKFLRTPILQIFDRLFA